MLKIGEFSRLSEVSVKALHHYDQLGLLRPAQVDPSTGYRFYQLEQLADVHRIMALKEVGLSLEQIKLLLEDDLTADQIRGMLRLRQVEIEDRLRIEQAHLARVEYRLRMIEAEASFPDLNVVMKNIPALFVLTMPLGDHHEMAAVASEVRDAIQSGELRYAGYAVDVLEGERAGEISISSARHALMLAVTDEQREPVQLRSQGRLELKEVPAIDNAATLVLKGMDRADRHERAMLLQRWAVDHDYRLGNELRVLHHRGPLESLDRLEWVSELQLAVD